MSCAEQQQHTQYLKRKRCLDRIHSFCQLKNWCLAELAYEEYVALCGGLWKEYDTLSTIVLTFVAIADI